MQLLKCILKTHGKEMRRLKDKEISKGHYKRRGNKFRNKKCLRNIITCRCPPGAKFKRVAYIPCMNDPLCSGNHWQSLATWKSLGVIYSLGASNCTKFGNFPSFLQRPIVWPWPSVTWKSKGDHLLSRGIHCTKFGNVPSKGSKDIERT